MKCYYFLTLLIFASLNASAQRKMQQIDEEESKKKEEFEKQYEKSNPSSSDKKWIFGGNFTGGLGSNSSFLLIQPIAGYKIKPNTIIGGGATYIYSSFTFNRKTYSTSVYGPLVYLRQNILESFFAQAEYQPLNYNYYDVNLNTDYRRWLQQLYLGGGYGSIPGVYIGLFYNVLFDNTNQIFPSPLDIRFGFFF